ncbi:hypothetical protein H7R52_02315 [Weissella confusa]|uniref:Uncharacterized protein n=1 Tax=Weissella confusa TaxID=1583 RepID=A0A923NFW0_WEICO|nr:hypothetical protein [Weissella confusa]
MYDQFNTGILEPGDSKSGDFIVLTDSNDFNTTFLDKDLHTMSVTANNLKFTVSHINILDTTNVESLFSPAEKAFVKADVSLPYEFYRVTLDVTITNKILILVIFSGLLLGFYVIAIYGPKATRYTSPSFSEPSAPLTSSSSNSSSSAIDYSRAPANNHQDYQALIPNQAHPSKKRQSVYCDAVQPPLAF